MIVTVKDRVLTDTAGGRVGEITAAVAAHVRELRASRGWSLDELAGRSGVSKGMVVQIEGARTNPSVGTLCRIADAFGVTIAQLLEPVPQRSVHLSDAGDAPVLWRGPRGGHGRLLRGVNHPALVELRQVRQELRRHLAQLALPDPDAGEVSAEVATLRTIKARKAARARWDRGA